MRPQYATRRTERREWLIRWLDAGGQIQRVMVYKALEEEQANERARQGLRFRGERWEVEEITYRRR